MRYFSELFATIILAQTIKKHFIKMAINGFPLTTFRTGHETAF